MILNNSMYTKQSKFILNLKTTQFFPTIKNTPFLGKANYWLSQIDVRATYMRSLLKVFYLLNAELQNMFSSC